MELKYVFGPVPSRRLGRSLGIDPIPFKTCNWNCVYCQLGRTIPLVNERREYIPSADILLEVRHFLGEPAAGQLDWITFIGSGEPTLHSGLGEMIRAVKAMTPVPVAVITNGSLLHREEVREELRAADAVIPSLDAGTESLYQKVNRPHPALRFADFLDGLKAFRRAYTGTFWIEVMLMKGFNDDPDALRSLAHALSEIGPEQIQINVPVRPPAEPWIEAPSREKLEQALEILGGSARVIPPASVTVDASGHDDLAEAILGIVERHPMSETELAEALGKWTRPQVSEAIQQLAAAGKLQPVVRRGERFWAIPRAHYADTPSPATGGPGSRRR